MQRHHVCAHRPQLAAELRATSKHLHAWPSLDGVADDVGHGHADGPGVAFGAGVGSRLRSAVILVSTSLRRVGHFHGGHCGQRHHGDPTTGHSDGGKVGADGLDSPHVMAPADGGGDHDHPSLGQAEEQAGEGRFVLRLAPEPALALSGVHSVSDPRLGRPALDVFEVEPRAGVSAHPTHRLSTYRQHWLRWAP